MDSQGMEVTSIILAGGKNLRLGRNKALENISGKSLIERVIERLTPLTSSFLIVTSQQQPDLPAACQAVCVADIYPGRGPLGGIYTGLVASRSDINVVVACDMPFLNVNLLRYMVGLAQDFDAVVPRLGEGKLEPLHAVYSRSCQDSMKTWLENNQLEVNRFLNTIRVRYVELVECQKFDPQLLSFFNVNRQSDLERAIMLASTEQVMTTKGEKNL